MAPPSLGVTDLTKSYGDRRVVDAVAFRIEAKYTGSAHPFGGMSVQFILFMGIDAAIAIPLARREGLWNRLLAAPVTVFTVLAREREGTGYAASANNCPTCCSAEAIAWSRTSCPMARPSARTIVTSVMPRKPSTVFR